MVTKHDLFKCRLVRRKPSGEQWSHRETIEARVTKWNFDVEMDTGVPGHKRRFQRYLHLPLRHNMTVMYPKCENKECTRRNSGPELSGQKSAQLLDAQHARLPVQGSHTLVNTKHIKMSGTRAVESRQRRRRNVEFLRIQIHDHWTRLEVRWILNRKEPNWPP